MIAVVAYLITFVFVTTIMFSISIHLIIAFHENFRRVGCCKSIMILIYAIITFLNPFLMFVVMIQFLYVLVLGEASAISSGPYTVLSLIPTAAVSAASWLLKNKVFSSSSVNEKEDKKKSNQEKENKKKSATNNGEAPTLVVKNDKKKSATNNGEAPTLVVNEETPFNGEIKTYGVAGNSD